MDLLKQKHPFLNSYWKVSLIEPQFIRLVEFYLRLTFIFALSALFFSDEYVENINNFKIYHPNQVELHLNLEPFFISTLKYWSKIYIKHYS